MDQDPLARQMLLEDYKVWLREIEKQDRWLYQGVWTVLAASAGALYLIVKMDKPQEQALRIFAAATVALVAATFLQLNGRFLATRISSYRMVSRRIAATRKALNVFGLLGSEVYRQSGVPMLSDNPTAFVRTALFRRGRSFRPLFHLHRFALLLVYALIALFLYNERHNIVLLAITAGLGILHYLYFATSVRYQASEAESIASFIVTIARDKRVAVAWDAEDQLSKWITQASNSRLLKEIPQSAIRVLITYEDRRFWIHPGFDPIAIIACALRKRRGGASTVAMQLSRQLIRNPLAGGLPSKLRRKFFEIVLGSWLVLRYGHKTILTAWLERVPFGKATIIGINSAAKSYFAKSPTELDDIDALLLAERLTVYTGKYYPARIARLSKWAVKKGLLSEAQAKLTSERYASMEQRSPQP